MLRNLAQRYEKEMKTYVKREKIIIKYKQYLKLEKSLSENTVQAYLTDLDKLFAYLTLENIDYTQVTLQDLEAFSAGLHDIGIHPRSQARILSGIRSFYHFLVLDDYIQQDPTELLESPQIGKHLPDVLSVEEIDALIGSIDRSTREGQRNCAILETLYSCGLRVSELCNLKISDLYFDEGFIKVEGKGSKQRLVPISPRAINEIRNYFIERNQGLIKPEYEDFVFISRFGKNISRIMVFHIIKELASLIGLKKKISPHKAMIITHTSTAINFLLLSDISLRMSSGALNLLPHFGQTQYVVFVVVVFCLFPQEPHNKPRGPRSKYPKQPLLPE